MSKEMTIDLSVWKTITVNGVEIDLVKIDGEIFDDQRACCAMEQIQRLNLGFVPWEGVMELLKNPRELIGVWREGSCSTSNLWYFPQEGEPKIFGAIQTLCLRVFDHTPDDRDGWERHKVTGLTVDLQQEWLHKFEAASIYWFVFVKPRAG
jgi:hypothetical protein